MSNRLIISSVHAENFGGLSNRHLDIPGESMVVIHGRNEVGKSTFTELITWLLVGPSTDSNVIRRLGKADEILVGEMNGRLKGQAFSSRGGFRITPKSWEVSARSEQVYELDRPLDLQQWLHGLKDIDRKAMEGIYRIWGQQLHHGGDADSEMRRAGLGSIAMSTDPRDVVKRLADSAKPGAKIGEGDTSFTSISTELKDVSHALVQANNNIIEFNSRVSELTELDSRLAEYRQQILDLTRRRANLESFEKLDELRIAESKALVALNEQPDAPEAWLPAVSQIHQLRPAIESCDGHRKLLAASKQAFAGVVSAVGLPPATTPAEVIDQVTIKTHHMGATGKAVGDVSHADKAHAEAADAVAVQHSNLGAAQAAAARAAHELGVDLNDVREAQVESAAHAFKRAYGEFNVIEADLSHARADVLEAEAAVAGAVESVSLAEKRWNELGIGGSAREWRVGGGGRPGSTRGATSLRKLAPVLVLALAALVAAALGQWVLMALIAVAAVIVFATTPSLPTPHIDPLVGETAEQMASAEAKLDLHESTLAAAKKILAGHEGRLKLAQDRLLEVGPSFAMDLPDDPQEIEVAVRKWSEASDLVEKLEQAQARLGESERLLETTAAASRARVDDLQRLLTGFGLPAGIEPNSAEDTANRYIELVAKANDLKTHQQAAGSAESALAQLLGPVYAEVSGWKLPDILHNLEDTAATHRAHVAATEKATNASAHVSDLIGDNNDLQTLVEEGLDTAAAAAEISEIDLAIGNLEQQRQVIAEQTGVVKEEIQRLQGEQQLADLRLRQGSLEEFRAEIGFEAASRRLASIVLQHMSDEHQRQNQPELIRRTAKLASAAAERWSGVEVRIDDTNLPTLMVNLHDGSAVPAVALSTGARALLYLSLRVAMAEHDTEARGVALPLICDDPLVHIDDERASAAMNLLARASASRQVVMFTCHERTMEVAESLGVATLRM